ncbi:hypothetical protein [Streptomyces sp. NPDC055036]
MSISIRNGDDARHGGTDITISLTPNQSKALGIDASLMADYLDTALWAIALLRTGRSLKGEPYIAGPSDWFTAINDLEDRLLPQLQGVRDAVVRAHGESGGSVGDLGLAMGVPRSTAQYRREALAKVKPSPMEHWATEGGPEDKPTRPDLDAPRDPEELRERIIHDHLDAENDDGK